MARSRPSFCALLVVVLAGIACRARPTPWFHVHGMAQPASERSTAAGKVVGWADGEGTYAWLGIPYAEPPLGALRWKAPRPHAPWAGTRDALAYGSECPQLGGFLSRAAKRGEVVGSEDCLTLNVYAPRDTAQKRPVMVWLHGGGNSIGTAGTFGAARNLAARYGVVVVTLNYRLGALGFFRHPSVTGGGATPEDRSGNYGLLDQLAALRWVQENVTAFGGDPARVTLFGESAGGFDVYALMGSQLSRGLFARAIVESGMPVSHSIAEAEHAADDPEPGDVHSSTELVLYQLQHHASAADRASAKAQLARMPAGDVDALLRARTPAELLQTYDGGSMGMYRLPALVRDGTVLPASGSITDAVLAAEAKHEVPLLVGTNRDEFKLFMALDPRYVKLWFGKVPQVRDPARYDRMASELSDSWRAVGVDTPALALQRAGHPVFAYRFDWDEEPSFLTVHLSQLLGAAHGLEIAFVFLDTGTQVGPLALENEANAPGRAALANAMSSYWVQFARTGQPGKGVDGTLPQWGPYADGRFMVLDTPTGGGERMEQRRYQMDETLERAWTTEAEAERCLVLAWLARRFMEPTGEWTVAQQHQLAERCPLTSLTKLPE